MNYISANSPRWRTRNTISLNVLFEEQATEIPFIASTTDIDPIGVELFNRAMNGDFGVMDIANKKIADDTWNYIQAIRDDKMTNGGCKVGAHWFHSDTHSKLQQLALLIAGENIPPNLLWKTMSGDKILMTADLIKQIYYSQMVQEQSIYGYAEYLKSLVDDSEFPESIDINTGWPEVFIK